ncbi:MAG TPA: hypothetical protein VIA06_22390 [Candidatus Dormibacteraeota bacterium]|nr:hypothetical protein [Candidatus Dormibacteraeota bacterium]
MRRRKPFPARITGRRWDVLAWNRASIALFGDYGALPEGHRNILWSMLMRPDWRSLSRDWSAEVERCVAQFRSEAAPHLDEPAFQSLLAELNELSPEFRELWARQDVRGRTAGLKHLDHPTLGDLELEYSWYQIGDQPGMSLCLYTPIPGSRTESVLRSLDLDAYGPPGVRTEATPLDGAAAVSAPA